MDASSAAFLSSRPQPATTIESSASLQTIPIKTEPADRPPPAPLLPSASFSAALPAQVSHSPTLQSTAADSQPTQPSDVSLPSSTASTVNSLVQTVAAISTSSVPLVTGAASHDAQTATASSNSSAAPLSSAHAPIVSHSPQLTSLSSVTHVAPTLPYAPSLPNEMHSATIVPSSTVSHATQHATSAPVPPICFPSTSPSTAPLPFPQYGSLSSPATMEQLLVFLLNEVSDLKRTVRGMQDEREERRRKRREKEKRRQEEEESEMRRQDERKEAETMAVVEMEETTEDTHGRTHERTQRRKQRQKETANEDEAEMTMPKRKHREIRAETDQHQHSEQTEDGSEHKKKKRKKERKRREKSHTTDIAALDSAPPSASTSNSSPSADSGAAVAASAPSMDTVPMLRIGFSTPSQSPVVSASTSSPPSAAPAVGRSLLRSASPRPSHTVFLPAQHQPPLPPARPPIVSPVVPSPAALIALHPSTTPSLQAVPPPATTPHVSVNQIDAVSQPCWDADGDTDDMPSLERVDGTDEKDGGVDPALSPAVCSTREEERVIDLSDECSPRASDNDTSTTTTTVAAASSTALPTHSPSLHPTSSSSSSAVSSSSVSSASPSLLQLEVNKKKAKLALLATQQRAAKQKAEQEADERRREAAARWTARTAEELRMKEIQWLHWDNARHKEHEAQRDRDNRGKERSRPMQQQARSAGTHRGEAGQQQQYRQKPKAVGWTASRSGAERDNTTIDHRNGVDETSSPVPWFEDRRGEKNA